MKKVIVNCNKTQTHRKPFSVYIVDNITIYYLCQGFLSIFDIMPHFDIDVLCKKSNFVFVRYDNYGIFFHFSA